MNDEDDELTRRELDRLFNDPSVPIEVERVWQLLADAARQERRRAM